MGILSVASGNSVWRGYDYFKDSCVLSCVQTGETEFFGKVRGAKIYDVKIDYKHPRKSSCNCPHAAGRRIVCKHMVALYFTVFPMEADILWEQNEMWEREEEEENDKVYDRAGEYIHNLSAEQAKNELHSLLMDSPEWVFDKFVREHGLDNVENGKSYDISEKVYNEVVDSIKYNISSPRDTYNYYFDKRRKKVILEYSNNDRFKNGRTVAKNNVLPLPRKADFDRAKAMLLFAGRQKEPAKAELTKVLSDTSGEEHFADAIKKYELDNYWLAYLNECIRIFAEDWCRKNIGIY